MSKDVYPRIKNYQSKRSGAEKLKRAVVAAAILGVGGAAVWGVGKTVESVQAVDNTHFDAAYGDVINTNETAWDIATRIAGNANITIDDAMYQINHTGNNEDLGVVQRGQRIDLPANLGPLDPQAVPLDPDQLKVTNSHQ